MKFLIQTVSLANKIFFKWLSAVQKMRVEVYLIYLIKGDHVKFIDFCAGIGGGRLGLENVGMECVGFSEINKNAENVYRKFFGDNETNYGDLMKINPSDLPNFDLLIAGFPCQAFSIVGQRKGLIDKRGQIIFGLLKIMKSKNIKYFILENVKGLINHQQGQTFKTLLELLDVEGYAVVTRIMDSSHYGLPHKRERVYFIGMKKDLGDIKNFHKYFHQYPQKIKMNDLRQYLIDDNNKAFTEKKNNYRTFLNYLKNKYNRGKVPINKLLEEEFLVIDTRQSDLRLYREKIPTLRAGRHGLLYVRENQLRKLSGYESLLLQGFPKNLALKIKGVIPENQILSQSGNAMSVGVVEACGRSLVGFIKEYIHSDVCSNTKLNSNRSSDLTI